MGCNWIDFHRVVTGLIFEKVVTGLIFEKVVTGLKLGAMMAPVPRVDAYHGASFNNDSI